jgi:hypothetical protein
MRLGALVVLFANIFFAFGLPLAFRFADLRFAARWGAIFFGFGGIKHEKSSIFE